MVNAVTSIDANNICVSNVRRNVKLFMSSVNESSKGFVVYGVNAPGVTLKAPDVAIPTSLLLARSRTDPCATAIYVVVSSMARLIMF